MLIVGDRGGTTARTVFGGFFAGGGFSLLGSLGRFWSEVPSWSFDRFFRGGSLSIETNPALLGVGYLLGPRISLVMLAGGVLSFLVLVPAVHLFGAELTSPLIGGGATPVREMTPGQIRSAFLLYIGAGAVAAGGLVSLVQSLPSLVAAFSRTARTLSDDDARAVSTRTDRDLPALLVLGGVLALAIAFLPAPRLGMTFPTTLLVLLFGFFIVTVSIRITGQIGSSSNPISGMTVATLLATCLLFLAAGRTGVSYKELALCTAALVCVAASNGGTISQDLRTGFLLGATPWRQQVAILVGVASSALVIGLTLAYLNEAATTIVPRSFPAFSATDSARRAADAGDAERLAFEDEPTVFRGRRIAYCTCDTRPMGLLSASTSSATTIASRFVDPGVCGVEAEQRSPDGSIEKVVSKFDAPKAQLFRLIIDGVLDRDLPWPLVLIGVFIALMMELCGVPSLPFAVGAYLPFSTSGAIALGGVVRALADRRARREAIDADSSPGVLCASGLIAGGAIAGLLFAALAGIEVTIMDAAGQARPASLLQHYGIELAPRLLGADAARALLDSANWSILPFLALALVLFVVASRRERVRRERAGSTGG